jgi:hypothetical protein
MIFAALAAAALLAAKEPYRFSAVMSELSANPQFVEAFLDRLDRNPAAGGILGPEQVKRLRDFIFGKQWEALDRFPGITVTTLGRGVALAGLAQKSHPTPPPPITRTAEPWPFPGPPKPLAPDAFLKPLGFSLLWGDRVDPALAPLHADSLQFSALLNRLSLGASQLQSPWGPLDKPESLLRELLAHGYSVELTDTRYFANFGDLIYKDRDVVTPFWLNTAIPVPGTRRTLHIPVAHSQHELRVRGPDLHAAIAFYFGIDGKALWRAIDTKDQAWVLGRAAHRYTGDQALDALRIAGLAIRAYDNIQRSRPDLPFGGYYALGVCNDVNALIEQKLTGRTTLYPLTHDKSLFRGQGEIDTLIQQLPVDRSGRPSLERILGSLPTGDWSLLPGGTLRADLELLRTAPPAPEARRWLWWLTLLPLVILLLRRWRRRSDTMAAP